MRNDLIQAISDQLIGVDAPPADLRKRLDLMQDEFAALGSESPKAVRDQLIAIQDHTGRAARAIAEAPDAFEELCREVTGSSSTALAVMLHELSERVKKSAKAIEVRKVRSEAQKKLCAWFAWQLFDEFSEITPTLTPSGAYIVVAELMAELLLGGDAGLSMSAACREVIEGRFPGS